MLGIVFKSMARRSETAAIRTFGSLNDCFKMVESSPPVSTPELYSAFKYMATDNAFRKTAIRDERYSGLLRELESRLSMLNSSYLGNFALRLQLMYQANNYLGSDRNEDNVENTKKLMEKIASTIMDKGGHVKEVTQVAYAAASMGLVNHPIFEFEKQQMTLNIEVATPDSINMSLQTSFKRNSRDRVYLALLCEKLSELTDRFTANDVTMTLRSLSKIGLMKGFLLRRLITLMMDNLDQFSDTQLIQCSHCLAMLKFFTPNNFSTVLNVVKSKFDSLPLHLKIEILFTSCLSGVDSKNDQLIKLLNSVKLDSEYDMLNLAEYIYACVYYKQYGEELDRAVSTLTSKSPFFIRKYALLAKEALDSLKLESALKGDIPDEWNEALENFEKAERDRNEAQSIFQESKKILESSGDFKSFQKVGPYMVSFVDEGRKICVDVEYSSLLSNLSLKLRNLSALGYRAGVIKYWEWRRLKTEAAQATYISNLLQTLSKSD